MYSLLRFEVHLMEHAKQLSLLVYYQQYDVK
ncbi:Uncharacterised protein [Vibrio cholerae]|nr:Uncharacterised protein [Vibrio cholerae]CSA62917.1 Uncharacterised protein [Vibrio cholerae]